MITGYQDSTTPIAQFDKPTTLQWWLNLAYTAGIDTAAVIGECG